MLIGLDMRSAGVPTKPVAVTNPTTGATEVHTLTTSVGPSSGLSISDTNSTTGVRINYSLKPATSPFAKPQLTATTLIAGRQTTIPVSRIPPHVAAAIVPPEASQTGVAVPTRAPDPAAPPEAGSALTIGGGGGGGGGAAADDSSRDAEMAAINAQTFYASEKRQAELTIAAGVAIGGVAYWKRSPLIGIAAAVVALYGARRFERASNTYRQQTAGKAGTSLAVTAGTF